MVDFENLDHGQLAHFPHRFFFFLLFLSFSYLCSMEIVFIVTIILQSYFNEKVLEAVFILLCFNY